MRSDSIRAGARAGWLGWRWGWPCAAVAVATLGLLVASLLEAQVRSEAAHASVVRVRLSGLVFGLAIPLLALVIGSRMGPHRKDLMRAPGVRWGFNRRGYALGLAAIPTLLVGAAGSFLAGLGTVATWAITQPEGNAGSAAGVLLTSALLGGAAGVIYSVCLGAARLAWPTVGTTAFLVAEWVLGSGSGFVALPWPRAHLRAMLGGHSVLDVGTLGGLLALLLIALAQPALLGRRLPA